MRKDNIKKQDEQTPVQARPNQSTLKKDKEVIIKASLLHLDGTESEITMIVPKYTLSLEAYEDAGRMMAEYINVLTRYWLQIERFQVQVGVMKDGKFEATLLGNPEEIPLNMVFEPGASGKWITPMEAMSVQNEKGGSSC